MALRIRRQSERELTMEPIKPPMPVHVRDIQNFARLALGLTEGSQMIWSFRHKSSNILAFFTAYMYWDGDIPILAYTEADLTGPNPSFHTRAILLKERNGNFATRPMTLGSSTLQLST